MTFARILEALMGISDSPASGLDCATKEPAAL
jgi:hypothetical protein